MSTVRTAYTFDVVNGINRDQDVMRCSVCKALVMRPDAYAHTDWHALLLHRAFPDGAAELRGDE